MVYQHDNATMLTCPDCREDTCLTDAMARGWHIDLEDQVCQCAICYRIAPWFREWWNAKAAESSAAYLAKQPSFTEFSRNALRRDEVRV